MSTGDVDKLFGLVRRYTGPKERIENSTRLYQDLDIAGEDASDLMEKIAEEFGVDFSGFAFDRYFPNDLDAFIWFFARKIGLRDKRRRALTIGHLLSVIKTSEWFDPPAGD